MQNSSIENEPEPPVLTGLSVPENKPRRTDLQKRKQREYSSKYREKKKPKTNEEIASGTTAYSAGY